MIFAFTSHITGLMGLPRRVYTTDFGGAVILVLIAYAIPLRDLLSLERFGSPGFSPF